MRSRRRGPILIADDDAVTLDGLSEFLTQFGYRVVPARDGQQAMNLLVEGLHPSLLIIDLAMPNVCGDELLKYVHTDPDLRLVPVLVVTGAPERLGRTVADAVVQKPVDLISLLAHVKRLTTARSDNVNTEVP
jgi:CheY-like chemotaxis protein